MSRAWSLALPALTVLVVLYALLVAGVPRPILAARIYGGPTEAALRLSLRVEVVERDGEHEAPYWNGPVTMTGRTSSAQTATQTQAHASSGVADFALSFPKPLAGPVELDVRASDIELAHGDVSLGLERWAAPARHRGGWIRGRDTGGLVVSVAAGRGAFVVGSADPLLIRVERAGQPVPGARLVVKAEGALLSDVGDLRSDARGRARIGFRAVELNPTLRVEARADDGASGLLDTGVPVVPGGLHAARSVNGLRIDSATPRSEAYFSVVSSLGRVSGGALTLSADQHGGWFTTVELPALPHPAWAVVSSEVDQNSAAAIGWPLDIDSEPARTFDVADARPLDSEPARTFDVADALLLDGLPAAFAREQARRSRVRWLTAAFIALSFALSVVILVLRVRAADRQIAAHLASVLEGEARARVAPRALWPLLVGLLAIGLGFVALGLLVAARSR